MIRRFVTRLGGIAIGGAVVGYCLYLRSDAYRRGNRLFYHDGRPNALGRAVGDLSSWAGARGIGPSWFVSLETVGHRTGRRHALPVVVADHGGERYVISMLGERAGWVHNVRAADGRAVIAHGRRDEVVLVEVPPVERAPILKATSPARQAADPTSRSIRPHHSRSSSGSPRAIRCSASSRSRRTADRRA